MPVPQERVRLLRPLHWDQTKGGYPLSDHRLELQRHASRVLAPGEHLRAAIRAMPLGPYGGSLAIFSGSVVGTLVHSASVSRSVKKARLSRFPLAGRMVVGMSDRRILVWQTGGLLGGAITSFLGHVPLSRISKVEGESVAGRSKITFIFRDARAVTVEADTRDDPQRFVEVFHRSIAAPAVPRPQPASGPSSVLPA